MITKAHGRLCLHIFKVLLKRLSFKGRPWLKLRFDSLRFDKVQNFHSRLSLPPICFQNLLDSQPKGEKKIQEEISDE